MYLFLYILGGLIILALILVVIVSFVIANKVVHPHRYTREEQKAYNKKMNYDKGCEVLKRTDIEFTMKDGYLIHGDYCLNDPKKMCILVHGHGTSREGALSYSLLFHELGYSTLIYDQPNHGDNIWGNVTMGIKESQYLKEIIE